MGRCQGFDCQINVAEIISKHCDIPLEKITKRGPGSEIISNTQMMKNKEIDEINKSF